MTRPSLPTGPDPRHVSLVALPDAAVSTLTGIFDVLNAFALMEVPDAQTGGRAPFRVEIVGEAPGPLKLASGVPINVQRAIAEIETTDIVIVPSVLLGPEGWDCIDRAGAVAGFVKVLGLLMVAAGVALCLWPLADRLWGRRRTPSVMPVRVASMAGDPAGDPWLAAAALPEVSEKDRPARHAGHPRNRVGEPVAAVLVRAVEPRSVSAPEAHPADEDHGS